MEKIDILLSTYNGAQYLQEQFDSILTQTYENWIILIRDDGSTDATQTIIETYINQYPEKIFLVDKSYNIGVVKSFEKLLLYSSSKYIMFCDQDDIWLPKKIELTYEKMVEQEVFSPGKPILIYTDLKVVDNKLATIAESFWHYSRIRPDLLNTFDFLAAHNAVTGCTVMINETAKLRTIPFNKKATMHDAWIALNVISVGGIISFVDKPTVLYRQHGNNVLGADNNKDSYLKNKILNITKVFRLNIDQYKMINELRKYSLVRYFYFKIKYFLKMVL